MMKNIVAFVVFTAFIPFFIYTNAEAQDVNKLLYDAYVFRSVDKWKAALELRKAAVNADSRNEQRKAELALAYFSMFHGSLSVPDEDLFDDHVDDAKKLLNSLIEANPKSGIYTAMLANIYGDEIGYSPMKGMTIGYKAGTLAAKGKTLDPDSPLTWYVFSISKFHTPAAFGGDIKQAADAARKSIELMESSPSNANNWMYLDALVVLGNAELKLNNKSAATEAYNKALAYEPQFEYVRELLRKVNP